MGLSNDLSGVNPYKVLGVEPTASSRQIKKAFRRLSKKLHPDVGGNEAEFATLSMCYNILMDDEKRAYFDETGQIRQSHEIDKEAAELMIGLFEKLVGAYSGSIFQIDVVVELKQAVREAFKAGTERIRKNDKEINFWNKLAKQLIKKKEGPPILEVMIDRKLQACRADIAACQHAIEIGKRALELLEMYGFEIPEPTSFLGSALSQHDIQRHVAKFGSKSTYSTWHRNSTF